MSDGKKEKKSQPVSEKEEKANLKQDEEEDLDLDLDLDPDLEIDESVGEEIDDADIQLDDDDILSEAEAILTGKPQKRAQSESKAKRRKTQTNGMTNSSMARERQRRKNSSQGIRAQKTSRLQKNSARSAKIDDEFLTPGEDEDFLHEMETILSGGSVKSRETNRGTFIFREFPFNLLLGFLLMNFIWGSGFQLPQILTWSEENPHILLLIIGILALIITVAVFVLYFLKPSIGFLGTLFLLVWNVIFEILLLLHQEGAVQVFDILRLLFVINASAWLVVSAYHTAVALN